MTSKFMHRRGGRPHYSDKETKMQEGCSDGSVERDDNIVKLFYVVGTHNLCRAANLVR